MPLPLPPDSTLFDWGIGAVSLMGSMVSAAFISAWRMRSVLADIEREINKARTEISEDIHEEYDRIRREYAETMHAFRQKLNDVERQGIENVSKVELFGRDNYTRRDDLANVYRQIDGLGNKIESAFQRMEEKIDRVVMETMINLQNKSHK